MEGLSPTGHGPGAEDVEAVRECVELMQVATGKVRLYGDAHPESSRAIDALAARLDAVLEVVGPIALFSSPDGFTWRGASVSEDTDDKPGLSRWIHVEGISMLGFAPGVDANDLRRLLEVLRTNLSLPQYEEETMESLLWQAEMKGIAFRAIAELMRAEAESGREDDQGRLHRIARSLVELQPGDLQSGRRFAPRLSDADVRGGDIVDQWQLDASLDSEPISDEEWGERFAGESGDDVAAVAQIRDTIRFERSSQLLSRLVRILVRAACSGRPEVPADRADELVVAATRNIYGLGDPVGLLEIVEWTHRYSESLRSSRPELTEWLRDLLRRTYSPLRVARLVRNLDPADPAERRVIERFMQILPDPAVVALFDGVAREEHPEQYQPVLRFVCAAIRPKLVEWLRQGARMPTDRILPLVEGLRIADVVELAGARPALLTHSSSAVRESVLEWYGRDLPDSDVPLVAASLVDRSNSVRDAAARVLVTHRPPEAVRMLTSTLRGEQFKILEEAIKVDLCTTFGRLAGPAGLTTLTDLLNERTGLLRDADAVATVNAAALGLAAMGTPNAVRVLEKGARAFAGVRRSACQVAIGVLAQQRAAEEADA